jgi:hypothetical protein
MDRSRLIPLRPQGPNVVPFSWGSGFRQGSAVPRGAEEILALRLVQGRTHGHPADGETNSLPFRIFSALLLASNNGDHNIYGCTPDLGS